MPDIFDSIEVGHQTYFSKTVSEADISAFADISGDFNPIHVDAEYAKNTIFKERIAHGILTASFISTTIAALPGEIVYLSQNLKFTKPVKIGDTIKAVAEVKEKLEGERLLVETTCTNQRDEVVVVGEAKVKVFEPSA